MHLLTLSLTHATAPLAVRERASLNAERSRELLGELCRGFAAMVPEIALLSTCNRTELYCAALDPADAEILLTDWLSRKLRLTRVELATHVRALPQASAVRHAFRVASGLDSMLLGEPQILGQMKGAVRDAQLAGSLGSNLHQLFQRSFSTAKEVRSRTGIGRASVSLAAAAVRLAEELAGDLRQCRVLLVGAGDMMGRVGTHFGGKRPRALCVANRSAESGERLARRLAAQYVGLDDLPGQIEQADIVVTATGSTVPVIYRSMVEPALRNRLAEPLIMIDLAVPRDIDPEVGRLREVRLHTLDDLAGRVRSNASLRHAAVTQAESIIQARVEEFMQWHGARTAVPALLMLDERAQSFRAVELQRAHRALARGVPVEVVLERLATALSNKLLHVPRRLLSGGVVPDQEAGRLLGRWLREPAL